LTEYQKNVFPDCNKCLHDPTVLAALALLEPFKAASPCRSCSSNRSAGAAYSVHPGLCLLARSIYSTFSHHPPQYMLVVVLQVTSPFHCTVQGRRGHCLPKAEATIFHLRSVMIIPALASTADTVARKVPSNVTSTIDFLPI
jgi:hypothetical protein